MKGFPGWTTEIFVQLIKACGKSRDLSRAVDVHRAVSLSQEHRHDRLLSNLLIELYGKCSSPTDARGVFNTMEQPNRFSWNILLQAYAQNGAVEEASEMFVKMPRRDIFSWTSMLTAFATNGLLLQAQHLFFSMPCKDMVAWTNLLVAFSQSGLVENAHRTLMRMPTLDVVSWSAMLAAYAQAGHIDEAEEMFNSIPERNTFSWNAIMQAYTIRGETLRAKGFFNKMPSRDSVSWGLLVGAHTQCGDVDGGLLVLERMPQWDVVSWNILLDACAESGNVNEASRIFFVRIPQRSDVSWTLIVQAYSQRGLTQEACSLLEKMPLLNAFACISLLKAFAEQGNSSSAQVLFDEMAFRNQFAWSALTQAYISVGNLPQAMECFEKMPQQDVVSWTEMCSAYAHSGQLDQALELLNKMPETNVISWSSLIQACVQRGFSSEALELFHAMQVEGVLPNEVTLTSVLTGCSHAGLVSQGRDYLISMEDSYGVKPCREHYVCMVDLLGRSKQIHAAEELINNMPFLPDDVAWTVLLSACNLHGDSERGSHAAKMMAQLVESDGTPYVLLFNTHAQAGLGLIHLAGMVKRKRKGAAAAAEEGEAMEGDGASSSPKSLYEILGVEKTASQEEIKKAYHRLALRLHPDKNPDDKDAKEKFQTLQNVMSVLSDPEKRAIYDETGSVEGSELLGDHANSLHEYFRTVFKPVTEEDIEAFAVSYRGSKEETEDLKKLYTKCKGNMDKVYQMLICSEPSLDSHRFMETIDAAIASGELKEIKAYRKWAKAVAKQPAPADPFARPKKNGENNPSTDLVAAIRSRGKEKMDSLFSSLEKKYGKKPKNKNSNFEEPTEEEFEAASKRMELKKKRTRGKKD